MRRILICLSMLLIASCASLQASETAKTAGICEASQIDRDAHAEALLIDGGPLSKVSGARMLARIAAGCSLAAEPP